MKALSAKELGIAPIERKYLKEFVQTHEKGKWEDGAIKIGRKWFSFLMTTFGRQDAQIPVGDRNVCGTAGCIAGYIYFAAKADGNLKQLPGFSKIGFQGVDSDGDDYCLGKNASGYGQIAATRSKKLHDLFTPDEDYHSITDEVAVKTVRRFLKTGRVRFA